MAHREECETPPSKTSSEAFFCSVRHRTAQALSRRWRWRAVKAFDHFCSARQDKNKGFILHVYLTKIVLYGIEYQQRVWERARENPIGRWEGLSNETASLGPFDGCGCTRSRCPCLRVAGQDRWYCCARVDGGASDRGTEGRADSHTFQPDSATPGHSDPDSTNHHRCASQGDPDAHHYPASD